MVSGEAGAANTVIPSGRYRGRTLGSLSLGYLKWASTHWPQHGELRDLAKQIVRERTSSAAFPRAVAVPLPPPPKMLNRIEARENPLELAAYASLLKWCASAKSLEPGKKIHRHIAANGLQHDPHLCHLLVEMYGECGALGDAHSFFSAIDSPNALTCNFMMRACARHGHGAGVLQIFRDMLSKEIAHDNVTILLALTECGCVSNGKLIHYIIMHNGVESDTTLTNAMISLYGQHSSVDDAQATFGNSGKPDVITWNAMISAYAHNEFTERAFYTFNQMQQQGERLDNVTHVSILDACVARDDPSQGQRLHVCVLEEDRFVKDPIIGTSLISMYGKRGNLESARRSFEAVGQRTMICCTAMMAAYVDNNRADDALGLFCLMDAEGLHPTKVTFVVALDACADGSNLFVGEALFKRIEIMRGGANDVKIATALINMFGRCGNIEEARHIFDQISMVFDLGSWNAMVATYSHHGQSKNSFDLFEQLRSHGMKPNIITYVSVLSACSHEGLVYEACQMFSSMSRYNIEPVEHHYNCVVDLLARAGRLDEAEYLVNDVVDSTSFIPAMTLLAACKNQIDATRGVRMANLIFQLGMKDEDPSLVFSSIRAAGRVQAVDMAFNRFCINVDQLLV